MNDDDLLRLLRDALVVAEPRFRSIVDDVTWETHLADLGLDSLTLINMLAVVEDKLDIELPDDRMVAVRTVAEAANLIRERLSSGV